ncbi:MAG: mechanosensitive ion channel family protein [Gammaproteobacteria bacterium]|nr:mechanosensitive ion channel family protein [Gammaproteobacteria bacterium]
MDLIKRLLLEVNWETVITSASRMLLILIVAWIVMYAVKMGLRRLTTKLIDRARTEGEVPTESSKRVETLVRLLRQAVSIALWIVVILIVLREVGVEIGPLLASAGILGLAVGFGAQNLVRDVISGFFMILENQVRVGDVAIVNGTGGVVEKMNFRTIVLRDLSGVVHVFPNGTVSTLSNMTQEWSAFVLDMGVAYKEDVDKVMDVMRQVAADMRADEYFGALMIQDIEVLGVDDFADSAVVIKARLKTMPIKQWEVGREYRRRLKQAFDREGIEIPFPHRSIYFGEASKPILAQLLNDENATSL